MLNTLWRDIDIYLYTHPAIRDTIWEDAAIAAPNPVAHITNTTSVPYATYYTRNWAIPSPQHPNSRTNDTPRAQGYGGQGTPTKSDKATYSPHVSQRPYKDIHQETALLIANPRQYTKACDKNGTPYSQPQAIYNGCLLYTSPSPRD